MLPRNPLQSRKSPKFTHVAHLNRIAFVERALLEWWLLGCKFQRCCVVNDQIYTLYTGMYA